ncbi:MAG: trypsin-like peptidase domain-containing protein [Opitutae bacterium]|jgi:hypothetical protein|nr:trypsin-like peptidase domain-containing protein [Opitutae bacterium]
MATPLFLRCRLWQLCALLWLGSASALGQGFVENIQDANQSPLERAKRARQELLQRIQEEDKQSRAVAESLEGRIIRLKRELAAAEVEWAKRNEPVPAVVEVKIASAALVVISSEQSEGSGFIAKIRGRTFLITNIHVLGAARSAIIQTLDGVEITLPSYGYVSRRRDIAIVPIEWAGPTLPMSQSLSFDEVGIGQAVTVVGNSDGARVVGRLKGEIHGIGPDEVVVSAKFVPGNSGSPIVHDGLGRVIAIASHLKDFSAKTKWSKDWVQADVRRFGYRLDGEIEWAQVALSDLYRQAEVYNHYEDRSRAMSQIGHKLQHEDQLMTSFRSHDSLGYLFEYFDRDFQWHRGTNSSHNQRLLKRFVTSMLSELQTDRVGTGEALEIDFYQRRFLMAEDLRDQAANDFISFADSRLD